MRFTPEFLDEIKARVTVSDVVGRKVRLKKQGREWRGLSPFNTEKTPSFFVNDAKMAWFDFSSGRNGNVFDFLMATEGVSFPEAVERLAGEAGIDLPKTSPEAAAREERRASLTEVLELACQFFERCLTERTGGKARAYLDGRQISADMRAAFRLGYAPAERFALRDYLAGKGADAAAMIEAGLLIHGDDIPVPYDRFRDRVMFPIADRTGRVIAFGGRTLDPGAPAKYLNSPETPLFHKGAVLYNLHKARHVVSDRGTVIAVEGYVDVIAMTAVGFPHVVAPLGTALTPDQCELLWKLAPEPTLCFDGDGAGRRAAFKAVDTALPLIGATKTLRFAFLPDGQDPDDLARAGGGAAIQEVLAKSRPLVDVLWLRETEGVALDTPEQKTALDHRLAELGRQIGDETLRRHYATALRDRMAALRTGNAARPSRGSPQPQGSGRGWRPPFGKPPLRGYVASALPPPSQSLAQTAHLQRGVLAPRDVELLTLLLNQPVLLERHAEDLAHIDFDHADLSRLRDVLVGLSAEIFDTHMEVKQAVDAHGCADLRHRLERAAAKLPHWCTSPDADLADAELVFRQVLALHRKARELHKDLKLAELALGREATEQNFSRVRDLLDRLGIVEGTEASVEGFGTLSGHRPGDV